MGAATMATRAIACRIGGTYEYMEKPSCTCREHAQKCKCTC